MSYTWLLYYIASVGATYFSIKCLLYKLKSIDRFDLNSFFIVMLIPFVNVVGAFVMFIMLFILFMNDVFEKQKQRRKVTNRRSFIEMLFGLQREENFGETKYVLVKKKKEL